MTTHSDSTPIARADEPSLDAIDIARSLENPKEFEAIFERHHETIFRYVVARVGESVADDVVSETFLAAYATRHRFESSRASSALPWLYGIATKRIARQRSAEQRLLNERVRLGRELNRDSSDLDRVETAETRLDAKRIAPELAAALSQLKPRERDPLLLAVLEDLWSPTKSGNPLLELDIPRGHGPRQRQLGTEMLRWMHTAATSSSRSVINAETRRFMSVTFADQFRTTPPIRLSTNADGEVTHEQINIAENSLARREQHDKADKASRIRQAMYLLTTMRPSAEATRYLYSRIGAFDDLERLSNVMVDGRLAIRIRFDATDPELAPTIERVLVIDARTGYAVRTETLDRSAWTTVSPSHHVQTVGADPVICGEIADVPCDLINGDGQAAVAAQRIASTYRPFTSNDAFNSSSPIAPRPHIDGVGYSGVAACARDANWVSICRG